MTGVDTASREAGESAGKTSPVLSLLPRFSLESDGGHVDVPLRSQRVLALLALEGARLRRSYVAGTLWPEASEERAAASLRAALWAIPDPGVPIFLTEGADLRLDPGLHIDYREALELGGRVVRGEIAITPSAAEERLLGADLLTEWSEDWLLVAQERYRQVRLHALEALSLRLTATGQAARAVEAGLLAVAAEPLRESAHRALIAAHLAEGNVGEAIRQAELLERLLSDELGIEPSPEFRRLTAGLGRPPRLSQPGDGRSGTAGDSAAGILTL